jgi:hypothetical protein
MSRRRKIALAVCAMLAAVVLLWPRDRGPTYEGKTVEEWFQRYCTILDSPSYTFGTDVPQLTPVLTAFEVLGTNAVPFLAGQITRDQSYSTLESWQIKLRESAPSSIGLVLRHPRSKYMDGFWAAELLRVTIKSPGELLVPLLEPALQSFDPYQKGNALSSLEGISSGYELALPHLIEALNDSDPQVCFQAAETLGRVAPNGAWISKLGTNAAPAVLKINLILAEETNAARRRAISNALRSAPPAIPDEIEPD